MNGHEILIRAARPGDASKMGAVQEQAWRVSLAHLLPANLLESYSRTWSCREIEALLLMPVRTHRFLVAQDGGDVAGFVWFGVDRHDLPPYEGQVYSLYVAPGRQHAGVGTRLLREAMRELARRWVPNVVLWVLEGNSPARRFYERSGGAPLGVSRPLRQGHHAYPSCPMVAYGWDPLPPPGPE